MLKEDGKFFFPPVKNLSGYVLRWISSDRNDIPNYFEPCTKEEAGIVPHSHGYSLFKIRKEIYDKIVTVEKTQNQEGI